jgi:hypothetical protein
MQNEKNGARCSVRTCKTALQHKTLTVADSQIDAQKIRSDAMLIELMRTCQWLRGGIQRALLELARASARENAEKG